MRRLRDNEAVVQLAERPRCLHCRKGLLLHPEPGSSDWPCNRCGRLHAASGQPGWWIVLPVGNEPATRGYPTTERVSGIPRPTRGCDDEHEKRLAREARQA